MNVDVEYGPDGEPFDPSKDYSEYETSDELAWMQDAIVRLLSSEKFHSMTIADQLSIVDRLQDVCRETGEDFVESAYVEETIQEFSK